MHQNRPKIAESIWATQRNDEIFDQVVIKNKQTFTALGDIFVN